MNCYFCKNEIIEEEEPKEYHDQIAIGTENLETIHHVCLLDYFAWKKRHNINLGEHWADFAKKLFEDVHPEYRSKYFFRND